VQSKRGSLFESLTNTAVGFVLSVLTWEFIVKPVWDLHTSFAENISITLLFTVISILRGYVLRRVFNHRLTNKNKKRVDHGTTDRGLRTR
jgi:hypothetical protein